MADWLKKAKDAASEHSDKVADAVEKNMTSDKVDSVLERAPGGKSLADKVPDDINETAADAIRENLGDKKKPEV